MIVQFDIGLAMGTSKQREEPSPTSRRMRARIIDAVVEMVARHGLSGTTLANVAAHAGVSQGVLVFHFRSKDGLLAGALVRLLDEYRDTWQQVREADKPIDGVVNLIKADFDPLVCNGRKLALWFAFWGEISSKPLYNRLSFESEAERFQAMCDACRRLGDIAPIADPVLLAQSIDAHTDGLWLQMHLQGSLFTREMALEAALSHVRLLLPGLAGDIA